VVTDFELSSVKVFESFVVDNTLAKLSVVSVYLIFVNYNLAFSILIFIKECVSVYLDFIELVLAICALFAVSLEHWLSFTVELDLVYYNEDGLLAGSDIFYTKLCQVLAIVCLLFLCCNFDQSVFLRMLAF